MADIVGMKKLKEELKVFTTSAAMDIIRHAKGLKTNREIPVIAFLGNPGTGKTSVADVVSS